MTQQVNSRQHKTSPFVVLFIGFVGALFITHHAAAQSPTIVVMSTFRGSVQAFDTKTPRIVAKGVNVGAPGALLVHPTAPFVYVAPEWGPRDGQLITLSRQGVGLRELWQLDLGGTGSVDIALSPDQSRLIVAHYRTGSVSVVELDASGKPDTTKTLSLPVPDALPHDTHFLSADLALVTDVAHDVLYLLHLDGTPRFDGMINLGAGDRPRTISALSSNRLVVSNQRTNSVSCLLLENRTWVERGRVTLDDPNAPPPTVPPTVAPDPGSQGTALARALSPLPKPGIPGDVLAVSPTELVVVNRGPNELIRIQANTKCGLSIRSRVPSGAKRPRALVAIGTDTYVSHELGGLTKISSTNSVTMMFGGEKVWTIATALRP
jgi:Lactonase, 7-bladed beta-propeller